MAGRVKEWTLRIAMATVSLLVALGIAEIAVRIVYPINDGRSNIMLDGTPLKGWFPPNGVYRQVSNEYDARTTITSKGHRVPGADGNPDIVFLGDSFTYGWGLSDDDTFASLYCRRLQRACANLGMPGSGTSRQVRRLQQFLDEWQWKPKEVKLFFFGMSNSFSAGNDFLDNYNYVRIAHSAAVAEMEGAAREQPKLGWSARLIGSQSLLLEKSNLVRIAKYHWGPLLRSLVLAAPGDERKAEALALTKRSLEELDSLSRRVGFDYTIYLLVPVQDVIRGTYGETLATLDGVSPKPAVTTAPLFVESPQDYYFAYDGHINAKGSHRIADFLIAQDAATPKF